MPPRNIQTLPELLKTIEALVCPWCAVSPDKYFTPGRASNHWALLYQTIPPGRTNNNQNKQQPCPAP